MRLLLCLYCLTIMEQDKSLIWATNKSWLETLMSFSKCHCHHCTSPQTPQGVRRFYSNELLNLYTPSRLVFSARDERNFSQSLQHAASRQVCELMQHKLEEQPPICACLVLWQGDLSGAHLCYPPPPPQPASSHRCLLLTSFCHLRFPSSPLSGLL